MLSVVITTHHDEPCCYLTAWALRAQLEDTDHEIIVVADGGSETKWENQGIRCLRGNWGSPQGSRDAGIRAAMSNEVLVVESHVVVSDPLLLKSQHVLLGGALTFPQRRAEGTEMFDVTGHLTDWDGNLWHKRLLYKESFAPKEPYRVGQFGNSCFMLDRQWYLNSGGYSPELMKGWGGEEPFICLKSWMLGRECWQVPDVWHAHYLTRGAHAHNPHLENNIGILGYLIAGRPCSSVTASMVIERARIYEGPFEGNVDRLRGHLTKIGAVC